MRFVLSQDGTPDDAIEAAVAEQMDVFLTGDSHRPAALRPNGRWVERIWRNLADGRRLVIHRDVTELKERELELRQARDATEQTRVLMETVLDNMTDGVMLWDETGEWRYANKALCDIQQVGRERLAELRHYEAMARARLDRGFIDEITYERALERHRRADGSPDLRVTNDGRWVESTLYRLSNGSTLGVYRDVTALKKQELTLSERSDALQDALEFQSAVGDVLRVISRSAFNLDTVLATVLDRARALCQADMAILYRYQDGVCRFSIGLGLPAAYEEHERGIAIPPGPGTVVGRAILEGHAVHIADAWTDTGYQPIADARIGNVRSMLGVPLLRDGQPIGVIALGRSSVRPYSDHHIERVSTFGDQAAIAIENARLFEEQQAAQREIERERALMRAILDNVTDGMGLYEANGDIALWNDAMYEINGFPRDIFDTVRNVETAFRWQADNGHVPLNGQNPAAVAADMMTRFLAGEAHSGTSHHSGGRWVDTRWRVLPDGRRLSTLRDITALKERELELQEARDATERARTLMDTVLENMNDGLILWDPDGEWRYANKAFCDIQQSSPERLARLRRFDTMMDALLERGLITEEFRIAAIARFNRADGAPKIRPPMMADGRRAPSTACATAARWACFATSPP